MDQTFYKFVLALGQCKIADSITVEHRGDQQPEQEWSRSRSLAFFVGAGVDSESQFFGKTGSGARVQFYE